ncbi:hypothetical protein RD792_015492 [Penstemon davidsonii]|uniref:Homeobox domain-containing protein n=1 Tax=Penstemon davidsonii TaxID=160366 RepID=A0ABR0CGY8_9LAMI|nr:hypothetical protein RD792_015492 [Penstemon davidsonii]
MEWQKATEELNGGGGGGGGGMFVKVMTDEQMEVLRKQIAVYAIICQQLVDLHKSLTAQNDLAGVRLGNMYCDPLITSGMHKITSRQRWTPTPMQLQILERIFEQGTGNPSRIRIQEITSELSQHGQISQTNVSNWFQNRRARSKRKQHAATPINDSESDQVDKEIGSSNETGTKTTTEEDLQPQNKLISSTTDENVCFENSQDDSDIHSVVRKSQSMSHPEGSSKFGSSFEQISFYGSVLPNQRMEESIEKMEAPGNYNPY